MGSWSNIHSVTQYGIRTHPWLAAYVGTSVHPWIARSPSKKLGSSRRFGLYPASFEKTWNEPSLVGVDGSRSTRG